MEVRKRERDTWFIGRERRANWGKTKTYSIHHFHWKRESGLLLQVIFEHKENKSLTKESKENEVLLLCALSIVGGNEHRFR